MFVKYLILFFISMVPIVELRGAIPYSVVFGLPLIPSYIICVIGNMLPVPFIVNGFCILFLNPHRKRQSNLPPVQML